jgi:hypothetical protein
LDLARYLVDAVVLEKRSCREVSRTHGVSKSWVAKIGGPFSSCPRTRRGGRPLFDRPLHLLTNFGSVFLRRVRVLELGDYEVHSERSVG